MNSSSAAAPPQIEYGADEISAIVLDPGYSVTRAGFAGEDSPKSVIPTHYGSLQDGTHIYDDSAVFNPSPGIELRNPLNDDITVNDWDAAARLWEYAITSRLTGHKQTSPLRNGLNNDPKEDGDDVKMEDVEEEEKPLTESPLLMTEPGWNPVKNREKMVELAMESWGTPAFYLGRSGVLAAFASGKATSLVIDIGASTTSVTPVCDGMILKKGTVHSRHAGNYVSDQVRLALAQSNPPVPLVPHYMVSSKTPVDAAQPAQATYRSFATPPRESFKRLQEDRVLTEFKESCVRVWNPARNAQNNLASSVDTLKNPSEGKPFEFPDGWNNIFGAPERYRPAEGLFDAAGAISDTEHPAPAKDQTIPGLCKTAIGAVDTDVKGHLLGNVIVTGGTSLLDDLTDRVNYELTTTYPGPKVRLQAPGNIVERKYANWIGGSILASLGTFHQMWVSRKEYEEQGPSVVEKRCK